MSFLCRYVLSFTPVILVVVCIFIRGILDSLFLAASPMVPALFPVPAPGAPGVSSAAMAQYQGMLDVSTAGFGDLVPVLVLLVVPVGIFLLAAGIGSSLRRTEVWTGPVLTLVLSAGAAYVLTGSSSFSMAYLVRFLAWIAFLVQPFSIPVSVLVLLGTEKFRRSIEYTITPDTVAIRGGIFRQRELTIPHSRIGRVIFEQDLIGSWFNYGTVIPESTASRDEIRASGQTGTADPGTGTETFRDPRDCLFGIPDPKAAQRILEKMMERPGFRDT